MTEKTIATIKKLNRVILFLAMAINFFHQTLWFWELGAWLLAPALPLAVDLMIVLCTKITNSEAAARSSKQRALFVLFLFVAVSTVVSAMAPGAVMLRFLFSAIVLEIVIAEWLLSSFKIREDGVIEMGPSTVEIELMAKLAAAEAEIARMSAAKKSAAAAKRRSTREQNKITKELEQITSGIFAEVDVPMSPVVNPYM